MHREIDKCRICGNHDLKSLVNLGAQRLTGVFPKSRSEVLESGPLELVKCFEGNGGEHCGLVQLRHTCSLEKMYGDNYGYRSGLNRSMVAHLKDVADKAMGWVDLREGDVILDIGSNDGTLLQSYPNGTFRRVGIDPTATIAKFGRYYPESITRICDFFSADRVKQVLGPTKAKIVTSIAMFYDLDDPCEFVRNVCEVLAPDGVWVFEQSYMPMLLEQNAYDVVCHEHLEYYGMRQIKWMLDAAGLKIVDLEQNDINGGSFKITAAHSASPHSSAFASEVVNRLLDRESKSLGLASSSYRCFEEHILRHKARLLSLLAHIRGEGKMTLGYGASTKGNVILQYCGITAEELPFIGEVNEEKFGAFTPGSLIPIIPEAQAKAMAPDYFLVLPWHFRENILQRERETLASGVKFIFPLPDIEIVSEEGGALKIERVSDDWLGTLSKQ